MHCAPRRPLFGTLTQTGGISLDFRGNASILVQRMPLTGLGNGASGVLTLAT